MKKPKPRREPGAESEVAPLRARLDAIGVWESDPPLEDPDDAAGREILWKNPSGLESDCVPFTLWFRTEEYSASKLPDAPLFALWERYRARHAEHVAHFRRECARELSCDPPEDRRTVTAGRVVVTRYEDESETPCGIDVEFVFDVEEHCFTFEYDADSDAFGEAGSY